MSSLAFVVNGPTTTLFGRGWSSDDKQAALLGVAVTATPKEGRPGSGAARLGHSGRERVLSLADWEPVASWAGRVALAVAGERSSVLAAC